MKRTATLVAGLALSTAPVLGLAAPASAASSSARCLGEAISYGATTYGPRAVAEHHRAVRAEVGTGFGRLTASVASLETCE